MGELEKTREVWRGWLPLSVLGVGGLVALVLLPTTQSLLARWVRFDEAYSHGFLLLMAILVLVWQQPVPARSAQGWRWPWLAAMLPAGLLWSIGHLSGIILFEQLALPVIWLCGVGAIWSGKVARAYAFPILFLYFAIPIWDHLTGLLVMLSVKVVSFCVAHSSIPVIMTGNQIEIPSGVITVADGCSGERYLIVGLAFGVLAARLYFSRWSWRLLVVALALLLGLVTNWLRIYLLVLVGYFTEMRSSLMHDHELFGFVLFAIVFAGLVWLIRRFSDPVPPRQQVLSIPPAMSAGPALVWAALLAAWPLGGAAIGSLTVQPPRPLPQVGAPRVDAPLPQPLFTMGRQQYHTAFWQLQSEPGQWLLVIHSGFGQSDDLLPYATLIDRSSWVVESDHRIEVQGWRGHELVMRPGNRQERLLVQYFMVVGDYNADNQYLAKLAEIPARLAGQAQGTLVALVATCPYQDCEEARFRLAQRLAVGDTPTLNELLKR